MKILLLDHRDDPFGHKWAGGPWDAVFDLGRAGWSAYERWAHEFRCPVQPLDAVSCNREAMRRVRELLESSRDRLLDSEGLDWWELTSIMVHQRLETLVLLKTFAKKIRENAQVFITRNGLEAEVLRLLIGERVRVIEGNSAAGLNHPHRYRDAFRRLSASQIIDVLGDKYDGGYRLRRHFHRTKNRNRQPFVLVPSAYVNVSHWGMAYAKLLPETNFLLVSTRRSGRLRKTPTNVSQEWLASYASDRSPEEEREILAGWGNVRRAMVQCQELSIATELGLFDEVPRRLCEGIAVRNAWREVFDRENVTAVFCADSSNPYTHIPLMLANRQKLPTIASHHGALDGRYLFKPNHADTILAKGKMEWDYLVNVCGVSANVVEIGAPRAESDSAMAKAEIEGGSGKYIVFFSEPYEMPQGRSEEIYRDIVPSLVELARAYGKKLMIKLHPSESLRERKSLTSSLLGDRSADIGWSTGRLAADLVTNTWFGITVASSAVMDCALKNVPCFVCEWIDLWPYGYGSQYRKFELGIQLRAADEIASIPMILQNWRLTPDASNWWQEIDPRRFHALLANKVAAERNPSEARPKSLLEGSESSVKS